MDPPQPCYRHRSRNFGCNYHARIRRYMTSVLITGTSKGIGLATALILGRAGYTVHATMRDPARSPELAKAVEKEHLPVRISAMDVDSDTSVRETIASIQSTHGAIDVLV